MNLNKLDISVCMAFQASEGPFDVLITFDGGEEKTTLSKEEIKILSEQEFTIYVQMYDKSKERRWRQRSLQDRRFRQRLL